MKFLGIDFGSKKIGLAIADQEMKMAIPYEIVYPEAADPFKRILEVVKEGEIDQVILGLPLIKSGEETAQTKRVKKFGEGLKARLPKLVELIYENEIFSTLMSEKLRQDVKDPEDAAAAAIILQGYLDRNF